MEPFCGVTFCACGNIARGGQRTCPECHNASMRKHRREHKLTGLAAYKANVRSYANTHKNRGRLTVEVCMLCSELAEMHHPDYDQPLLVLWLCREHHLALHAGRVTILAYPVQPALTGVAALKKTVREVLDRWLSRKLAA